MFAWRTSTLLALMDALLPAVVDPLRAAMARPAATSNDTSNHEENA
jgi:hypothetical protein